jgi:hypothetical protein
MTKQRLRINFPFLLIGLQFFFPSVFTKKKHIFESKFIPTDNKAVSPSPTIKEHTNVP